MSAQPISELVYTSLWENGGTGMGNGTGGSVPRGFRRSAPCGRFAARASPSGNLTPSAQANPATEQCKATGKALYWRLPCCVAERRNPLQRQCCPASMLAIKLASISGLGQNTSPFTTHPYSKGFLADFSFLQAFYQTFHIMVNDKFNRFV